MAFCRNCGRELQEGEVCGCTQQQAQNNYGQPVQNNYGQPAQNYGQPVQNNYGQPVQNNYGQPYQQPVTPAAPSAAGIMFANMGKTILGLLKSPATTAQEFVKAADAKIAMIFIGVYALLTAIMYTIVAAKFEDTFYAPVSPVVTFFISLIIASAVGFGLAAILMLFIKVFKGNATFNQTLCVSGISSIISSIFVFTGIFAAIIFDVSLIIVLSAPVLLTMLGGFLGFVISSEGLTNTCGLSPDKKIFAVLATHVAMAIAFYLLVGILGSLCFDGAADIGVDGTLGIFFGFSIFD